MEIVGKVIMIPGIQKGISKTSGKEWMLKTFVIETQEQYPRKVAIEMFGEERINSNPVELDQLVTASVDVESREVNGRWFTSVRAWKVAQGDTTQCQEQPQQQQQQQAPASAVAPNTQTSMPVDVESSQSSNDDLPF